MSGAAAATAPSAPAQLQVNLMTAPMAVPTSNAWLSWVTRDSRAGQSQSAYQVRVATSSGTATSGTPMWDSGKVTGTAPYTAYHGPALGSYTRYWWTVRTYDAQGTAGPWATPAQFQTALGGTWAATPIWSQPAGGKNSGWAFLRGTVSIASKPVIAATVYATGLSTVPAHQYVFRLSVNGQVLGDGPAQPPAPGGAPQYQAWDVTPYVKGGAKTTFGALAYAAADQRFELELIVEFEGGARASWGTGPGWQALDGGSVYPAAGSVGTAYYAAPVEDLNAQQYPWGFDTPSFTATGWSAPAVKAAINGLAPLATANMQLAQHTAKSVTMLGTGHYLIDFGTTQVGGLRLYIANGSNGRKVTVRYGEVLASNDKSVQYKLSAGNTFQDVYTLRAGAQNLQLWGYRVFRYAEVINTPQAMTAGGAVAMALVYPDQPSQSSMTTSDASLNTVWNFTKSSVEALNLNPYVDPARERGVYEGDNYIHQLAQAAVAGDSAEARYSLLVGLTAMAGNDPSNSLTEYRLLAPVAALASWYQTGNSLALYGLYPNLQKMLLPVGSDGLVKMSTITSLIMTAPVSTSPGSTVGDPALDIPLTPEQAPNVLRPASTRVPGVPTTLVDWPPSERDGFVFTSKTQKNVENTVVNAFAYAAYNAMGQIAAQIGKASDAAAYQAAASSLASAIQAKLYDSGTSAFYDGLDASGNPITHESMLSSVYVVAMGAASPAQAQAAAATIAAHGLTTTACSVYCAAYYLQALFAGGQAQAAIDAMTADTTTSWRHMIDMGAGSTTEAWDPSIKGNMSYSHAWATGPAFVVPGDLFGVLPLSAGWGKILVAPQPGTSLTSGSVTVPTQRGPVSASFTQDPGGALTVQVNVPTTAVAQVALPGVTPGQQVLVDGIAVTTTALAVPSMSTLPVVGPASGTLAVVQVGSGAHTIAPVAAQSPSPSPVTSTPTTAPAPTPPTVSQSSATTDPGSSPPTDPATSPATDPATSPATDPPSSSATDTPSPMA
jgi:alpha-L-rhamnosidase